MLFAAHIVVKSFGKNNGIIVYKETTYGVSQGLNASNHSLLGGRGIELPSHNVPDDSECFEAYSSKEPPIASTIFGGHRSPNVEGDGVKRRGGNLAPRGLLVDFGGL